MTSSHALLTLLMCALGSSLLTLENARGARDCDAVHAASPAASPAPLASTLANHGCGRFASRPWGGADGFCASEMERPWSAQRSVRRIALERLRQPARSATPERGGLASALAAAAFSAPTANLRGSLEIAATWAASQTWRQLETLGWTERALAAGRIKAAHLGQTAFRSTGATPATLGRPLATRVLIPTWHVVRCSALNLGGVARSGLDRADAQLSRALAIHRCREWWAADKRSGANARPLTHWRAKRPRVVGVRPGDAGPAWSAAALRLQAAAAASLAGAGHTMLDLARTVGAVEASAPRRTEVGAQARKAGFLEL